MEERQESLGTIKSDVTGRIRELWFAGKDWNQIAAEIEMPAGQVMMIVRGYAWDHERDKTAVEVIEDFNDWRQQSLYDLAQVRQELKQKAARGDTKAVALLVQLIRAEAALREETQEKRDIHLTVLPGKEKCPQCGYEQEATPSQPIPVTPSETILSESVH